MENIRSNNDSLILHYAAISAKLLTEENPDAITKIKQEQVEIQSSLGMTKEEIIVEAKRLTLD